MIEKIKIGLNNLYLFKNKNDEYLLLDTGVNVKKKKILKKIIQKIENVKKIKVIVLSHSHSDHVGNLKMLVDEIGDVRVIAHKNSENVLVTGKSVIPNGFYPFTEKISKKLKSKKNFSKNIFPKLEKTDMEKVIFIDFLQKKKNLLSEYGFGNMEIIETKGHLDDSVSVAVFDEKNNKKYLFCGDLVQNLCFKIPLIPLFGENKEELIENWKNIILNGYDKIFPATGKEVIIRDLIRRLGKDEKIEFKIIQNSDYSDEIRNILNDEEMESLVQVMYEKVPNLFESLQKDSEKTPIIVAGIDVKTGYLVGVGACSIFKNNIGYLNSFRIKKEYRNKVNFGKAYEMLITEAKKLGVKNIVTTILEENKIAQKILTKRRKSMPIYEFYKNIVFFSLKNVKKGDLIVKDEEILKYGNFEIHLKNKTNKKYVVKDYKKIYKFLYKFRKVIAFFGYPEMPEINKISNFLYTDFVLKGKNADEKKNKNEFRKAVKFVQNKGYNCDFFMIGSYENSFLEKNLDKMKVFKYKSKMYKVFYEKIENVERDNNFRNENIEILFWNL